MRILVAGDTHGNLLHVNYLLHVAVAQGVDRIFQVGDFGYWEHEREGVDFLRDVNRMAQEDDITIYFLDGNHDKTSLLLQLYSDQHDDKGFFVVRDRIRYAPRGHQWEWDDARFIALGGAYSIDKDYRLGLEARHDKPEAYWFPEEEMTDEELMNILVKSAPVDVMLTHDKPLLSNPRWSRKNLPECVPNQLRLQWAMFYFHPEILVHGHLHYRYDDTIGATKIYGLNSDPNGGGFAAPYRLQDSWIIVQLKESPDGKPKVITNNR